MARAISKQGSIPAAEWKVFLGDVADAELVTLYTFIRDHCQRLECEWRPQFALAIEGRSITLPSALHPLEEGLIHTLCTEDSEEAHKACFYLVSIMQQPLDFSWTDHSGRSIQSLLDRVPISYRDALNALRIQNP